MGVSWSWGQSQLESKFEFEQIGRFCDMSSSDNGVLDSGHTGYDPYTGSRGRATQPGPSMRFSSDNAPSWPSASWRLKPRRIRVGGPTSNARPLRFAWEPSRAIGMLSLVFTGGVACLPPARRPGPPAPLAHAVCLSVELTCFHGGCR